MHYPNGCVYTGNFVNGQRHGRGRMEFPNLDVYDGEFLNGLPNGEGSYFYFNCKVTVSGTFANGKIQSGEIVTRSGCRLTTEFSQGAPQGKATYRMNGLRQDGRHVDVRGDTEETRPEKIETPEDPEASIIDEAAGDTARLQRLREDEAREREAEADEPENAEEGDEAEKPDPREKELRALKPSDAYVRRTIDSTLVQNSEAWKTIKPKWVPDSLPTADDE